MTGILSGGDALSLISVLLLLTLSLTRALQLQSGLGPRPARLVVSASVA